MDTQQRRSLVLQMFENGERNRARTARQCAVDESTIRKDWRKLGLYERHEAEQHGGDVSKPCIVGLTPDDVPDGAEVMEKLIENQDYVESQIERRYTQKVMLPGDKPVGIVPMGDLHMGNKGVDYKMIQHDVNLIKNTDGLYAIGTGDYNDYWIGKLAHIQAQQPIPIDQEFALVDWFFSELEGKLVAVAGGNHDAGRSMRHANIDVIKNMLCGAELLYDKDEICFIMGLGEARWRFKIRHIWRGRSIYNDTHGIEIDPKFGEDWFDVGIGSHTHRGTLFREFYFHRKRLLAMLTGTYKFHDRYAVEMGYPRSPDDATGALILFPDGRLEMCRSVETAVDWLKFLRG